MRDNTFDNFIKEKVTNHASAVPSAMWQRILQKKEKDRKGAWWNPQLFLIVGIVFISIVVGTYFWNNSAIPKNNTVLQQMNVEKEIKPTTNNLASSIHQQPINVNAANSLGLPNSKSLHETEIKTNNKTSNELIGGPIKNILASPEKAIANYPSLLKPLFSQQNGLKAKQQKGKINIDGAPITQQFFSVDKNGTEKFNVNFKPEISSLNKSISLSNLRKIPKTISNLGIQNIDCPKSGDAQNGDWFIEVFGSPDLVTKQNTLNKGTNTRLLQSKDSSENMQLSFTAGVRFSKELGENMVFKTGLQFTQINEKFTNRIENERRLTTVVTTRTIIGAQGQTILVRDTSVTEQIGYSQTVANNKYRSIDIPLLLGYVFTLDGWQIGINGGPIINVKSWQEGEGLDANFQPVSFSKNKATVFKKNTGLSLYGGLSIIKWIGARTSVFAEPYIRYNLSNLTNSSSIVNEKYKLSGILLGVRYNLSNFKATH